MVQYIVKVIYDSVLQHTGDNSDPSCKADHPASQVDIVQETLKDPLEIKQL